MQRRSFLGLGLSAGGLWATNAMAAASAPTTASGGRAKQVLIVLEQGGLSHIDTWDPKPDAVAEHRSPFKPISTSVPGVQLTELFAKTARHADKLAIVRSMHHRQTGHGEGTQTMLQGFEPGGPLAMPDLGTAVSHLMGTACGYLPPYVMVPGNHEQSGVTSPGFLSAEFKAFKTGGRDLSDPAWKMRDFSLLDGVDSRRLRDRHDLLSNLNIGVLPVGGPDSPAAVQRFQEQAFNVLSNPRTSAAFDLSAESDSTRDAYGRSHRGQCYLLGRRMVEEGVRFVVVDVREPETAQTPGGFNMNWDHHDLIYTSGSCGTVRNKAGGEGRYGIAHWVMMGSTDQAFAALLDDMQQRGLLAETLVCFVTEFGRTPRLNQFQGRDHWSNAYSIAFAGAGIRGGQVIGDTDRDGGFIRDDPHTPQDYAATIHQLLGIDRAQPVYTRDQRPVFLTGEGRPIAALMNA
ncbi:MAG: DUF1501 domain-containing protein [Pirellulales bacterium]